MLIEFDKDNYINPMMICQISAISPLHPMHKQGVRTQINVAGGMTMTNKVFDDVLQWYGSAMATVEMNMKERDEQNESEQ